MLQEQRFVISIIDATHLSIVRFHLLQAHLPNCPNKQITFVIKIPLTPENAPFGKRSQSTYFECHIASNPAPFTPESVTPTPLFRLLAAFFLLPLGTSTCAPPFSPPPPICTSSSVPPHSSCHFLDSSSSFMSAGLIRSHFIRGPVFDRSLTRKP